MPITEAMEWVPTGYGQVRRASAGLPPDFSLTSLGQIPSDRRPVEGGFEEGGQHLFHAMMTIDGVQVPGKTGEHLVSRLSLSHVTFSHELISFTRQHGANFPWGGGEVVHEAGYSILCWR